MPADTAVEPVPNTRRWLSERQNETVNALLDAGLELLGETGYEKLTVRSVAARAGVTHTTAYSYFSSKAHLVGEIYWRLLRSVPPARARRLAAAPRPGRRCAAPGRPGPRR